MGRCDYVGLLVPRPTHTTGPSPDEQALAWTLIIESGHIPRRTRLGISSRELRRPLRRRQVEWVQEITFQVLHSVWALLQANTGRAAAAVAGRPQMPHAPLLCSRDALDIDDGQ